jgi:hypothetical protein
VAGVLERELLDPARLRALERHQQGLLIGHRKEALKARTHLETRLARVKEEEHAQLRAIASGIDPLLVKEVVEELQREERKIREKLRGLHGEPDAAHALAALRLLSDHAADLRAVLRDGDPQDQRKVFTRTVRSVKWLPEEAHLEIRLMLPRGEGEEERRPQAVGVTRVDYVRARGGIRTHTSLSGPALLRRIRLPVPAPGRRAAYFYPLSRIVIFSM